MKTTDKIENLEVQFHRYCILNSLLQHLDGTILQGNRTVEASKIKEDYEPIKNDYIFQRKRFELSLYLHCLSMIVNMVESFRTNSAESGLRFDELQPIKSKIEEHIKKPSFLRNARNAWAHPEKTLLGKLQDGNISGDVVNDGLPIRFCMQIIDGEILVSDAICAAPNRNGEIVWFTKDYISVQKTIELLCEIREDIKKIFINLQKS